MAVAVVIVAPPDALLKVTVNPRSGSTVVSPATLIVISFVVSPAANETCPAGNVPPTKSVANAGFAPLPITPKFTLVATVVLTLRVIVNVNGVVPEFPSFLFASVAAIESVGASSCVAMRTTPSTPSSNPFVGAGRNSRGKSLTPSPTPYTAVSVNCKFLTILIGVLEAVAFSDTSNARLATVAMNCPSAGI